MKTRIHLFEFGDQSWCPRVLGDAETAYLATAYRLFPLARLWAEKISTLLDHGETAQLLDLCAGAGGAMPLILDQLVASGYDARATLTDLFPNPQATSHPRMTWINEPVDARRVSPKLKGIRTMFSAFHHFRPVEAKAILKDAFDLRRPICIFESGPGTLLGVASMVVVPVNVLLLMPFARPFRWSYLLFTYLIPLLPVMVLWDGVVSMLRVYSPEHMKELTQDLQASDYAWEIGRIAARGIPGGLPYLIGRPA